MPGPLSKADDSAVLVSASELERFTRELFVALGTPDDIALAVAKHLVMSNLTGHDSHGVLHIPQYVDEIGRGELRPAARPVLLMEASAVAVFDAGWGFGHFSTREVMAWCVERCREQGIAAAAIRHSTHIGRLGEYTEAAADRGLVAILTVGVAGQGLGRVAAFGGVTPFLGTNPWSIAVPARGRPPMVFDAATSAIAEGKVRLASMRREPVPPGTLIDRRGAPTQRADDLYDGGTLLPVGGSAAGHKGYGLGLAAAMLGALAIIGDGSPSLAGTSTPLPEGTPWLGGVLGVAIDPDCFGGTAPYVELVTEVMNSVSASTPLSGCDVLVPGDPERQSRDRRGAGGIPLPEPLLETLRRLARELGLEAPANEVGAGQG